MTREEQKWCDKVDSWGFDNFSGNEFVAYSRRERHGVRAGIPPEAKFDNMYTTLLLAQKVRDHFGAPVRLTSAYRCDEYNRLCGGASRSYHKRNRALDIQVDGVSAYNVWRWISNHHRQIGGLGRYSTFVHIDNGPVRNWRG